MTVERCIWCLVRAPTARFNLSHVLPEALGNARQQVLPIGTVCSNCNQYFGTRLEPVLMDHPLVHLMAVQVRVVDPGDGLAFRDQFFDAEHPSLVPVHRSIHTDIVIGRNRVELGVEVGIKGRIGRDLDARRLAFLSRAVHKIGFENLAWSTLVAGITDAPDLYSSEFDPVRNWVRRGAPPRPVRAMLWMMQERGIMTEKEATEFGSQIWRFGSHWAVDVDLLNQRYAVSLTSDASRSKADLLTWVGELDPKRLVITDIMEGVGPASRPS